MLILSAAFAYQAVASAAIDSSIIAQILQSAGAGTAIMLILLLLGIVQPKSYVQRVEKEADQWHAAYEAQLAANSEKDKALASERSRADAAVETAKIATEVLEGLRGRINAPEAQRRQARPPPGRSRGSS